MATAKIVNDNKTAEERTQEAILATLAELSGQRVGTDKISKEGTRYVLPGVTSLSEDIRFLVGYMEAQETTTTFSRTFRYRPWDGAAAFQSALMKTWGTSGVGRTIHSFFGSEPPEMRTIDVGPDDQIQIPWGSINFAPLDAVIVLGATVDRDYGLIFQMVVSAPKKYAAQVDGLFKLIEHELQTHSIYKGKAFTGAEEPTFLDPYTVNWDKVIYSDEVDSQLNANIWSLLQHTTATKRLGLPLKRSVLLAGPYGTGKSLAAMITAQVAVENGWTFIQCRTGKDNLDKTLQTARLYQPALVFYEDVDTLSQQGDPDAISKLLDLFDGIQAKGTELAMVLTSNHVEKIHKGMLRPGRLDAVIEIGSLDHIGFIKLVKAIVPPEVLDEDLDFDAVADAMEDFLPAFVKEAIDRSMRYALARTDGHVTTLTTEDFVLAANGLRPQLDMMHGAKDGITPDALGQAMERVMTRAVTSGDVVVVDRDDQHRFTLAAPITE